MPERLTAARRAEDVLRRCWWRPEQHPGEGYPGFKGLDIEITAALDAHAAEERERCARVAEAPAVTGDANDWVQSTAFGIAAAIRGGEHMERRHAALPIGTPVVKVDGYRFPGEIRAVFTNRAGELRYVVEATGAEYAGLLHIFNSSQIAAILGGTP